jgi:CBS domain-containing protein
MTGKKISSVLVTESDGKLLGIITVSDLLALLEKLLNAAPGR